MKKLTRNRVTAAGIIAGAMIASSGIAAGCAGQNINDDVYGPPEMLSVDEQTPEPALTQSVQYSIEENIPETVYGPPEMFDTDNNIMEPVYGPPEEPDGNDISVPSVTPYYADDNQLEDVYGPPEDFG